MADLRHIRVFISAPGDLPDERAISLKVLDDLQYDPDLRHQFARESLVLDPVVWDMGSTEPVSPPPPTILPNECAVVILTAWSHLGAPCTINGVSYSSSTAFVYHNVHEPIRNHRPPHLLVYRRTRPPAIRLDDPHLIECFSQYRRAQLFFRDEFESVPPAERSGLFTPYATPDEFRALLGAHMRVLIRAVMADHQSYPQRTTPPRPIPRWTGSPFPGLRAFQPKDAPVFFGRGAETDRLAARVRDQQFVAVIGASSTGKSSLVGAGLIPRLRDTATDPRWIPIPFTPDNLGVGNPFIALVTTLLRGADVTGSQLAQRLYETPELLLNFCTHVLRRQPDTARLMLFIDQFEELFTTVDPAYRLPFIAAIIKALEHPRVHVLVTVRSDFYGHCINVPPLAHLLEDSTFPLAAPTPRALDEMIQRPADRAGLRFEGDLAARILRDTGDQPGSLALMAYTLSELYRRRAEDYLTIQSYEDLGGVQGAVALQVASTIKTLTEPQRAAMPDVFRELVLVRPDGTVTRRRATIAQVVRDEHTQAFIGQMVKARLLVVNRGRNNQPYIELAHDALLHSWDHLAQWIADTQAAFLIDDDGRGSILPAPAAPAAPAADTNRPARRRLPSLRDQEDRRQADIAEVQRSRVRRTQELAQQHVDNVRERARKKRETIEHVRRESEQRRLLGQSLEWQGIREQTWHWVELAVQRSTLELAERLSSLRRDAQTDVIESAQQELIRTLLHNSTYKERYFAAQKLTGKAQAMIVLCLLQALEDDNEWVRQAAVKGLAATHDSRVLPFLHVMATDPHGDVSSTANAAIAEWTE